jgi:hypothetical protein
MQKKIVSLKYNYIYYNGINIAKKVGSSVFCNPVCMRTNSGAKNLSLGGSFFFPSSYTKNIINII